MAWFSTISLQYALSRTHAQAEAQVGIEPK